MGKIKNFLEMRAHHIIAYAVHQCACFCSNTKKFHRDAILYLTKYLSQTRDKGLNIVPDVSIGLEVFTDADIAGSRARAKADTDVNTAKSLTGFVIQFANSC